MLLKERINVDFMSAFKERNMNKKNFLGLLKGTIETQEKKLIESTDENVLKQLKIVEKNLLETIKNKEKVNLSYENEQIELTYLQAYIPKSMSEEEITEIVTNYIENGEKRNLGYLMGKFNVENNGKNFDNKLVSEIIKKNI
jgi:uncharacterized protein YqeY